jgi:threonyl-tRNA synthetase
MWERSGHWQKFGQNMFTCETDEGEVLAVKPMNCPGHVQIFNIGQKSYRDLPLRMAEFGACHRYEPSGALHGIYAGARLHAGRRAHLLPRGPDRGESTKFERLLESVYGGLRDGGCSGKLALRPDERFGTDDVWTGPSRSSARGHCGGLHGGDAAGRRRLLRPEVSST